MGSPSELPPIASISTDLDQLVVAVQAVDASDWEGEPEETSNVVRKVNELLEAIPELQGGARLASVQEIMREFVEQERLLDGLQDMIAAQAVTLARVLPEMDGLSKQQDNVVRLLRRRRLTRAVERARSTLDAATDAVNKANQVKQSVAGADVSKALDAHCRVFSPPGLIATGRWLVF